MKTGAYSVKFLQWPCFPHPLFQGDDTPSFIFSATSIHFLMFSRLIQAFGGSIGSVIGQAICRDAFHGSALGKAYSLIGSALALFPAVGPLCGGLIAEYFGWRYNFMFLSAFAIVVIGLVLARLPETLVHHSSQGISFYAIAMKLMKDRHVIGYGLIVAGCNGILFSYFAEGPFYFINLLGMGSAFYGATFMAIALSTMVGGLVSRMLLNKVSSQNVMRYGIYCVVLFSGTFTVAILVHYYVCAIPPIAIVMFTIVSQMGCAFGICMATSNALSLALVNYKMAIGVASSLFGFFYYIIIAVLTMMMGCLHNGTLLPMPLYFFGIGLGMLMVSAFFLRSKGG